MQLFNSCQTTANQMIELMNEFLNISVVNQLCVEVGVPGEFPSVVNQYAAEE